MAYVLIIIIWHGLDSSSSMIAFDSLTACNAAKDAVIQNIKAQNDYMPCVECFPKQ